MAPVKNDEALPLSIAHIFNEADKKLAIGVIMENEAVMTSSLALGNSRRLKIEFIDKTQKHSTNEFVYYGDHVVEIPVSIFFKLNQYVFYRNCKNWWNFGL